MQDNSLTDGENQKHEMRLTQIYLNNRLFSDSPTEKLYWMSFKKQTKKKKLKLKKALAIYHGTLVLLLQ